MNEENIPLLVKNQLNTAITETIKFHKAAFVHQAANFYCSPIKIIFSQIPSQFHNKRDV